MLDIKKIKNAIAYFEVVESDNSWVVLGKTVRKRDGNAVPDFSFDTNQEAEEYMESLNRKGKLIIMDEHNTLRKTIKDVLKNEPFYVKD